jgi:hypothetical protein
MPDTGVSRDEDAMRSGAVTESVENLIDDVSFEQATCGSGISAGV